ncbi:hypothetical protein JGU71_08020 [Antrihabitans sp. YC3-6]|uniref:Platelet-activating factor acetylhydrolase n=1 Tax=Antrihabitans stalagmiti TaxID=2799499 RepID=A0A934NPB7_9NOCA|nr:hypothetical protein [Antrihabitans stalagmiti]MBJ8338830.1 hypothetical protein [Antrihabitans stalagmiti]
MSTDAKMGDMAFVELALAAGVIVLAFSGWAPRAVRTRWTVGVGVVVVGAVVVVAREGVRWQLIPVLVASVIGLAVGVLRLRSESRVGAALAAAIAMLFVGIGGAAIWAFPTFELPTPTGRSAVGTTVFQLEDQARREVHGSNAFRTVVAQLWYPAERDSGNGRSLYLGRDEREADVVADGISDMFGVPGFVLSGIADGRTHARSDAEPEAGNARYPVVLFSPGSGGVRSQNTAWAEELASHGYVVVGLDHPYDSAVVVLEDGAVIRSAIQSSGDDAEDDRLAAAWTATRAADFAFALTQLERIDRGEIPSRLTGRLATDRAAATGHSLGGAAAILAAEQDPRFDTIIDIDGFPRAVGSRPYPQPLLAFVAGRGSDNPRNDEEYDAELTRVLRLSDSLSYRLVVPGAAHLSFTDGPLFLPPIPSIFGSLDREGGPNLTAAASLAFLDETLRNGRADLEAALEPHGELTTYRR